MFLILLGALFGIACSTATADTQFKGAIADSAGASIANAMVLIHWDSAGSTVGVSDNIGIKADLVIRTKQDGTFSIDLPPGFYDVFVAATSFTPASRKVRIKVGEVQEIAFRLDPDSLYTAEMGDRVEATNDFSHVSPDHVPEGTPTPRRGVATAQGCESACASTPVCKAYAFDTVKTACYFYSEVFMGGTPESRSMGLYSSGLSILRKTGFISAFKRSTFPRPPVPVQPPK